MSDEYNKTEKRLIEGMNDALAYAKGQKTDARTHEVFLADIDARRVRAKTKLSQRKFAEVYKVPIKNVRNWEQGRRTPDQAARVLLALIDKDPKCIEKMMDEIV